MSDKKSKVAIDKKRDIGGRFQKGVSGNPKGRPKKKTEGDLPTDFHEKVQGDSVKAFTELLKSASTRYEAGKFAKELAPYQYPKLSNIEAVTKEIRTIEIKWLDDPSTDDPMVKDAKILEGKIKNDTITLDDDLET